MQARETLLAALPVTQRRLDLAGISTAVLEGGTGPTVVLLHGPGANATHWLGVIPELVSTHHVVVPDLPGQGASEITGGPLDADRVLCWLGELIESTCATPPMLVGYALGGAIAARFAADHGDRLHRLILVDTLGLSPFEPPPDFGLARCTTSSPSPATTPTTSCGGSARRISRACATGWASCGSRSGPTTSSAPARPPCRRTWER